MVAGAATIGLALPMMILENTRIEEIFSRSVL